MPGPIPNPYYIPFPVFLPAMRNIGAITQATNALVTTTFPHSYQTGDIVRLLVPQGWGMVQANTLIGEIVVTSPTQFTITIDTTNFDAFVTPPNPSPQVNSVAQVIPVGENNNKLTQATRNVLPPY